MAADGGVLIALWDSVGSGAGALDSIYVVRSSNAGVSYATVLDHDLCNTGVPAVPVLATAPGTGTVLLLFLDQLKDLVLRRSADHGATYAAAAALAIDASASAVGTREPTRICVARTPAGVWAVGWSDERDDTYAGLRTDVYVRSSADEGATWGVEQRVDSTAAGASESSIDGLAAAGASGLFVLFEDRRNDGGRGSDFYANRSTTASPSAPPRPPPVVHS